MDLKTNWKPILEKCIDFDIINDFLKKEEEIYKDDILIFPPKPLIYNCFAHFNFEDTKVVILGQDPYINVGQAMGLAFSVPTDCALPPSLKNIFKEIKNELDINNTNPDLTNWVKQGVLLMNTSLTVRQYLSNSHKKQWVKYTDNIIKYISKNLDNVIFLLWGGDARKKKKFIDKYKHHILEAVHPSPLSAYRGFFGCNHFIRVNKILTDLGKSKINWET